jgi:glycosyltransferase involved in cell wall biosynthesis
MGNGWGFRERWVDVHWYALVTMPKISIVTPSYNQGEFLEDTILSVLDQGYPNLEYLLLDGGSTDNSVEIIRKYETHITSWRSHADDGQAAALREGFENATGEILNWLNSDDLLATGALQAVAELYIECGPDVVVAGGCRVFGDSQESVVHWPSFQSEFNTPEPMPVSEMLDMTMHWFPGEFFYQPEVFFPASAYRSVGGIDPTIFYTMDYDLWIRLALAGLRVVVTNRTLAEYREHPGQKTADLASLHRQMVDTANRYLDDDQVGLSRARRALLATSNRLALHRVSRRGVSLIRGLINV